MGIKHVRIAVLGAVLAIVFIFASAASEGATQRKLVAVEGKGYLETVDGYRVLHLKGTPEEMGYQHGVLLKESIRRNIEFLLTDGLDDGIDCFNCFGLGVEVDLGVYCCLEGFFLVDGGVCVAED